MKSEESFALKLETGRAKDPSMLEDFFACTLVVENRARIPEAEKLVVELFSLEQRRPKDPEFTHLEPFSFDFDDLRLYVKWKDVLAQKPTGLDGLVFEVQIKTFLQHAWGIATHNFIYKSDDVDWASSRIAFQVKAMLEHAELSIGEAKRLTASAMLNKTDSKCADLRRMIEELRKRWDVTQLPQDLRRLAQNVDELIWILKLDFSELWKTVDEATAAGEGAKTLNLSPYGSIMAALIRKHGSELFKSLAHPKSRASLFVAGEIDLPTLPTGAEAKVIRPPTPT